MAKSRMSLPLETAVRLFDGANILLIVALVAGVVATFIVVWMGNIKEEYSNRDIAESNERAAKAKLDSAVALEQASKANEHLAEANERAAHANERAAQAEKQAAEAKLALEKFRAPRVLTTQDQRLIVSEISKFAGQEYQVTTFWDLNEPLAFANQLHNALQAAKWKFVPQERGTFLLGGLGGIQVWIHPSADEKTKAAANVLVSVLAAIGKEPVLKLQNPTDNPKHNLIQLNIGTKP
jgi:hypothetical protein